MKHPRQASLCLMLCLGAPLASPAQHAAPAKPGPQAAAQLPAADPERVRVGSTAPDFTLPDENSKPVTLSDYRGRKAVVLVFYRGHW
jgi:cytochrome oxidase Cu insertion factor (SCO1/SenC/PrrC family)